MTALWIALVIAVGRLVPAQARRRVAARVGARTSRRSSGSPGFLPAAMLAALVVIQLFDGGGHYARRLADPGRRLAAVVALLLRRGFLVVFLVAVTVTAVLRLPDLRTAEWPSAVRAEPRRRSP